MNNPVCVEQPYKHTETYSTGHAASILSETTLGVSQLCYHNFEHNIIAKALSIMPA